MPLHITQHGALFGRESVFIRFVVVVVFTADKSKGCKKNCKENRLDLDNCFPAVVHSIPFFLFMSYCGIGGSLCKRP